MKMWLDTNGCPESFHTISRDTEGYYRVFHGDGEVCEQTEFKIEENAD